MKKVIRLTESDLIRLVKRVVREQEEDLTAQLKDFHREMPDEDVYNDHLDKMDKALYKMRSDERGRRKPSYKSSSLRKLEDNPELNDLTAKLKRYHKEMPDDDTYNELLSQISNLLGRG
jgi:hypothetical protein